MNPLVQPDPGLYIWTIVTFLVLLVLLRKFAWGPLLKALEERRDTIRQSLEDAKAARQEMEKLQQESTQILKRAHLDAESIVSKSWSDAEKLREEMKQKARAEADNIVRDAERQIEIKTGEAIRKIRNEVADLSVMIASKFIQKNLSKEDNDRLIAETLQQIDAERKN
ncbi:MAG: F0F1 ATP synthase subunit B [Acidobacteria bacterium]|nr:F0F1 ATP synthase subunit B [Acidobacteriota bacterium]